MLYRDQNPTGIPEVDNDISAMLVDGGGLAEEFCVKIAYLKGIAGLFNSVVS